MKISWCVIVAAAIAVVALPSSSLVPSVLANGQERTGSNTLTDAEVQAAIDRGLASAPAPRALYFGSTSAVSAVAYSPEIRIEILARYLKHSGGALSVSSVPASVRERLLFIALRSVIYKPPAGVRLSDAETVMFIDPQGMAPSNKHVPAVWDWLVQGASLHARRGSGSVSTSYAER